MPQLDDNAGLLTGFLAAKRYEVARPHLRGRVLDFGCANGLLSQWCRPDAYLGVDIDAASIEIARRERPGFRFERELPADEQFDTIVALALIEHLKDPTGVLATLRPLLSPAGAIVITTPHPRIEWAHTLGAKVGLFSHEAHEEHEDLIDLPRMKEIAAGARLTVAHYQRFLFGANQLFLLSRLHSTPNGRLQHR
jgi:2-polyprenyl-3-methyl-5-hydroxy-6-metoxy-1,4-benzoquinol methylase